jgi:aspartate-semialdehyde dehydrogenase
MPMYAQGKDDVFVGRIRRDEKPTKYVEYVDCWYLRKGAATTRCKLQNIL